ncbi:unnamed protein product [Rotaria sordida]|uniref:SGNH hydrolase-type esterase domain-containing protein n=1 Tax=Rotaria sordida TaxID=392033 RepID=A0A813TU26_9BILA|nr:unnamed protein product [Rotaria sordida]
MTSELNFEYVNEDSIDRLLKCRICSKPFIDPVITRDDDRFCRKCIIQKASINDSKHFDQQSSFIENLVPIEEKILLDMLDVLLVKCTKCQQINNRQIHLEEHISNKCPKRIVLCKASDLKCPWSGPDEERYNHMKQCTFQLLRPILTEALQCQKQLEQYRRSYNEQQHEIEQLKKQIQIYENRTEKLQKGYTILLELLSQQTRRCTTFEKDIQQIREQSNQENIQPIELKKEIEQLKEQYHQIINIPSNEFQTELHRLNQLEQTINDLSTKCQQLDEQYQYQNQQIIQLNKCQLEINQLQKEDQSQKEEIKDVQRKFSQYETQILLLARKKCLTSTTATLHDARVEELIESFPSDSEITLNGQQLNDRDMEFICKKGIIDKRCCKLQLEYNSISAKGATNLADGLYGNTTLMELQLSNNRISDIGAHALAQVLSINNYTLDLLELHSNNITDEGAEYLAQMLKINKTITLLGLGSNRIGDRGVRLLTSAITCYNETLQWLHLSSNKLITDGCVNELIEMLKNNHSLYAVWLNDCRSTRDSTLPFIFYLLVLFFQNPMKCVQLSNTTNSTSNILKYIALGASDAVGVGTSQPSKDGWVPKFASLINAQETLNLGRSGSTLSDAIREQLPKVLDQKPNVITIWLVVNDFNQQIFNPSILLNYKSNLNQMLSQLRTKSDKNTRILVGNIPDLSQINIYKAFGIPQQYLSILVKQWNDVIDEIVKKYQCELVDLFAYWKELAVHPEYISFDGFHPSANGYTRLAEVFYQQYSKK